jgi:hypothetical protein
MFKTYYTRRMSEILGCALTASDGLGDAAVQRALKKKGLILPRALAEYYALAGKHPINTRHNRLYSIGELTWFSDRLVFMEENQTVAYWGIIRDDLEKTNPIVWQGANESPIAWYAEDYKLSQFLMALWNWTMHGVQEKPESR